MPNGFPAFRPSRFPNDQPPTLFHPASPKLKPVQPAKDTDSMASTSTFSSTISLLKENVKSKFHSSKQNVAKDTKVVYEGEKTANLASSPSKREKKEPSARQRTAEAYMIMAVTK